MIVPGTPPSPIARDNDNERDHFFGPQGRPAGRNRPGQQAPLGGRRGSDRRRGGRCGGRRGGRCVQTLGLIRAGGGRERVPHLGRDRDAADADRAEFAVRHAGRLRYLHGGEPGGRDDHPAATGRADGAPGRGDLPGERQAGGTAVRQGAHYRDMSEGLTGADVRELNRDLIALGYATRADLLAPGLGLGYFSAATTAAWEKYQTTALG